MKVFNFFIMYAVGAFFVNCSQKFTLKDFQVGNNAVIIHPNSRAVVQKQYEEAYTETIHNFVWAEQMFRGNRFLTEELITEAMKNRFVDTTLQFETINAVRGCPYNECLGLYAVDGISNGEITIYVGSYEQQNCVALTSFSHELTHMFLYIFDQDVFAKDIHLPVYFGREGDHESAFFYSEGSVEQKSNKTLLDKFCGKEEN
jgi:hypothetical protein